MEEERMRNSPTFGKSELLPGVIYATWDGDGRFIFRAPEESNAKTLDEIPHIYQRRWYVKSISGRSVGSRGNYQDATMGEKLHFEACERAQTTVPWDNIDWNPQGTNDNYLIFT
jgi:hypothetical protein